MANKKETKEEYEDETMIYDETGDEDFENIDRNTDDEKSLDNEFELTHEAIKVHSNLKRSVTEDYILAHLGDEEKKFIKENLENASEAQDIVIRLANRGFRYEWDNKKRDWVRNEDGSFKKIPINENEKIKISRYAKNLYDNYMILPDSIAVLNRNNKNNYMLNILMKNMPRQSETEGEPETEQEERSSLDKIKEKMGIGQ